MRVRPEHRPIDSPAIRQPQPPFAATRLATQDVDECGAYLRTIGWEVGHNQLSPGRFAVAIDGVVAPRAQVLLHRHAQSFSGGGHTPTGAYSFGLKLAGKGAMVVNRRMIGAQEIAVRAPSDHIEFKLPAEAAFVTVAADAQRVDLAADATLGRSMSQLLRRGNVLPCAAPAVAGIAARLAAIATGAPALLGAGGAAALRLEEIVIDTLVGMLQPPEPIRGWSARERIVRRAEELIDSNDQAPRTVAELCLALAVPARTLEDAFRHCLGVTPRTFLIAMRLNQVRRFLARAPDCATVTNAAMRCGFFHLGRFSAQYIRLFGEMPSETLRRARG